MRPSAAKLADYNPQMETFEFELESETNVAEVFAEAEQLELAAELLEVKDEAELDQFLGKLIRRAGKAIGGFVRSPAGRAIGGLLKSVAKKALPVAGAALGGFVGGPIGAKLGSGLANVAGSALGLELEGLSHEDREFEAARQFVRLSGESVRQMMNAPVIQTQPARAAWLGFYSAARHYAPGLRRDNPTTNPFAPTSHNAVTRRTRGRWLRQGKDLIVQGI
jgi:uncharacterized protein (DUF697 family)